MFMGQSLRISGSGDTPTNTYIFAEQQGTINSKRWWDNLADLLANGGDVHTELREIQWYPDNSGTWVITKEQGSYASITKYYIATGVSADDPIQNYTASVASPPAPQISDFEIIWVDTVSQSATPTQLVSNTVDFANAVSHAATPDDSPVTTTATGADGVYGGDAFGGFAYGDSYVLGSSSSNVSVAYNVDVSQVATIVQSYSQAFIETIGQSATPGQAEVIGWNSTTNQAATIGQSLAIQADYLYSQYHFATPSHVYSARLTGVNSVSQSLTATQSFMVTSGLITAQHLSVTDSNSFVHNKYEAVTQNLVVNQTQLRTIAENIAQALSVTQTNFSVAYTVVAQAATISDSNSLTIDTTYIYIDDATPSDSNISTVDTLGYNQWYGVVDGDTDAVALEFTNEGTEWS